MATRTLFLLLPPEAQAMTYPFRFLIAEDQSLERGALVALLETEPDISVVAECATGTEEGDRRQAWHRRCAT